MLGHKSWNVKIEGGARYSVQPLMFVGKRVLSTQHINLIIFPTNITFLILHKRTSKDDILMMLLLFSVLTQDHTNQKQQWCFACLQA
jgi:hypothetical protein